MFNLYTFEIFLTLCICSILLYNTILLNLLQKKVPIFLSEYFNQFFIILIFLIFITYNTKCTGFDINFLFISTETTIIIKQLLCIISTITFFIIYKSFILQKLNFIEYFFIIFISLVSIFLLINTYNFISLYVIIELQALSFYILAFFQKKSIYSIESGLKYFISNSLFSCFFLVGCLLFYSILGTLNFNEITLLLSIKENFTSPILFTIILFSIFIIFITILFKLVIAPFHFWFPQIYDGAPISSTIYLSILPKISLCVLLIRFLLIFYPIIEFLDTFFLLVGLYSILLGCFYALNKKRLKKLIIYSSISQMGFPICIIGENTSNCFFSIIYFVGIYLFISILIWLLYVELSTNLFFHNKIKRQFNIFINIYLSNFSQMFKKNKSLVIVIIVAFFSLSGIPPFIGFLSKLFLLNYLLETNNYLTCFLICILSMFSIYIYIQNIKISFFENQKGNNNIQTQFFSFYFFFFNWLVISIISILFLQCIFPNFFINFFLLCSTNIL